MIDIGRRKLLTAAGGVGLLGAGGAGGAVLSSGGLPNAIANGDDAKDSETKATDATADAPEKVKAVKPLAVAFHKHIDKYFDGVRIFISPKADIVMEYQTTADNKDGVKTEFNQIAVEYAKVIKEQGYSPESDAFKQGFQPTTLSIITGKVQGVVPGPTVEAYVTGDINKDGYVKTIGVTGVERRTTTNS